MKKFAGSITDVPGITAGNWQDTDAMTGCTVVICEKGAFAGVSVRGAAPGTRETDAIRPGNLVKKVHAVLLSGGSAFGLDAAGGVMQYLEEKGVGFDTGFAHVPIVSAAVLFDLGVGRADVRPDKAAGYAAAAAACTAPLPEGAAGAGTGATVAKLYGAEQAQRGGLGCAAVHLPGGAIVSAAVAVNALGNIIDYPSAEMLTHAVQEGTAGFSGFPGRNTTIGVIATNARLDNALAQRLADAGHDGMARAIRPSHTMSDGDTLFAMATGDIEYINTDMLMDAAAEAVARAIVNAVS